MTGFKVSILGP